MKRHTVLYAALCFLLINLASKVCGNINDDYYYRPYPVLLVHGFNADNGTWNVMSKKDKDKNPKTNLMTTLIQYTDPNNPNDIVKTAGDPSIAKSKHFLTLVHCQHNQQIQKMT
jgi:hypothetical protein